MSPSSSPSKAHGVESSAGPVKAQDGMSDLKLHLREAITQPTDLIKQGTAPQPYFLAFEPSGKDEERATMFAAVLGASGLARVFAGMNLVRSNPDHTSGAGDGKGDKTDTTGHYSLKNPDEYVAAFNEKTEAVINTFTNGPLASMYGQCDGGGATSLDLEITRTELHDMVLSRIAGGLPQVGKPQVAELDKVLTRFTAALKPFKVLTNLGKDGKDPSPALPELKHVVVINYIKSTDITGGSGGIFINKPFTRLVVFSIKPHHWASALQKSAAPPPKKGLALTSAPEEPAAHIHSADDSADASGSSAIATISGWLGGKPKPKKEEKIKFALNTTVIELEFDDAKYRANKARFEGIFKGMAEGDEELGPVAESGGLEALGRRTCTIFKAL